MKRLRVESLLDKMPPLLGILKMYAVIKSGGKQHKVAEGEIITIEKIDAEEGSNIEFSEVLAVNKEGSLQIGKPLLEGAKVVGKVINHIKASKVTIIKMKRRQDWRKKQGHRQNLSKIEIKSIEIK